jgi:O-antigen ligase
MQSTQNYLIGNPFGTGWERTVLTSDGVQQLRDETPHNFYVQTLLRGGGIGILTFLTLYFMLLCKLFYRAKIDREVRPILLCLIVLLTTQLIYYIPYGFDYVQAIFLGAGIAWLRNFERVTQKYDGID